MNNAPPLYPAKLSAKLDLLTVTFEPVRQIVPPLDEERSPSLGSISLSPLFPEQVRLYIIPLLPCQYTAGPSSPATLSVKVELARLQ